MEANQSNQIPLIFQKGTHSNSYFEMQKQGVQFLKELQNTRLRVIFNVSTQVNISPFTSLFSSGNESSSDLKLHPEGVISSLTLIRKTEPLQSSNSTLLIIKARQSSASLNYLTLGYLVSSLFIYHSQNEQSLNSQTIGHFASLFDKFSKSHLQQLNRLSIINSNQHQKPSLLCVVHSSQARGNAQNELGFSQELFKNINLDERFDVKKVNEGLDEYFPSRAAFYLPTSDNADRKDRIVGMKGHLVQNLPGRKLLNFEITGACIEYLCYELCELYNQKAKKDINLVAICTQSLGSQKNRVTQHLTAVAVNYLISQVNVAQLPVEKQQLLTARDSALKQIDKQMSMHTVNCMDLQQYIAAKTQVSQKMFEVFEEMEKQNNRIAQTVNNNLTGELSTLDLSEDVLHLSQQLVEKVGLYCQRVSGNNIKKQVVAFVDDIVKQYSSAVAQKFTQQDRKIEELQIFKEESERNLADLQNMNSQFQKRYESVLSDQSSLNSCDVISMRESLNKKQSKNSSYKKEIAELRKELKEKSQEVFQMTSELDELYNLVERYENIVEKDKSRSKSKCQFTTLIKEFNEGVDRFHNASNQIEKIEDIVKASKKQFDQKKEELLQQQDRLLSQIENLKQQKKKLSDDLQLVVQSNEKSQETIQLFQKIVQFNKNGIQKSATENINQKILIAEMEAKIMLYRKSIQLITDYYKRGKADPLTKFTKYLQEQDIKQLLLAILKK